MKTPTKTIIDIALPIMQGLLASGHFTAPPDENGDPDVLKCDVGKDWVDLGLSRRFHSKVVSASLSLAVELIEEAEELEVELNRRIPAP